MTFEDMSPRSRSDLRANNLQPKLKQRNVVLTTVDTTKQGVGRAECTEAIGDDYATCAVVMRFKSHLRIIAERSGATSFLRSKCIISPQGDASFEDNVAFL